MASATDLKDILNAATSDVDVIKDFAVNADRALSSGAHHASGRGLNKADADELRKLADALTRAIEGGPREIHANLSPSANKFVLELINPIKQRGFLAEMTLTYLVTHLEAFIKDYVLNILANNHAMLRSSATLTYLEACEFSTIEELRASLAERQVDELGRGSIDDIEKYFEKKLSISLSKFLEWEELRECMYRRNLIVHNRGRINTIYRNKTGYTGTNEKISTDMRYVSSAADVILNFMRFVHEGTAAKFSRGDAET